MRKILVVLVMIGISGCSNKAVYDNFHQIERNQCVKEPTTTTYFECIERTNKSYEEYERERNEIPDAQKLIDLGDSSKKGMKK